MNPIFVDTQFFIAIFQETDQWHHRAIEVESSIEGRSFITTDEVLSEVLNYFSGFGERTRREVSGFVHDVLAEPEFTIIEQSRGSFLRGLEFYENRLDKGYSLSDCISMTVCRHFGITEVLTHDHHFEQEGFSILL